jgi:hypothetical protein
MSAWGSQARTRVPRIAEAAVERARLSVVPRSAGRRAARVPFVTLVSLILLGGVAGLLFFNTSMQQASFSATDLQAKATALEAQKQSLTMQLDDLRDPQRVATAAKKLGMVPPAAPAFLRLSDGKVLGKPVRASSQDAVRITPMPTRKPADLRPKPIVIEVVPPAMATATATAPRQAGGTGASTTPTKKSAGTKKHHDRQGSAR